MHTGSTANFPVDSCDLNLTTTEYAATSWLSLLRLVTCADYEQTKLINSIHVVHQIGTHAEGIVFSVENQAIMCSGSDEAINSANRFLLAKLSAKPMDQEIPSPN
jgi:hypothetical protein